MFALAGQIQNRSTKVSDAEHDNVVNWVRSNILLILGNGLIDEDTRKIGNHQRFKDVRKTRFHIVCQPP